MFGSVTRLCTNINYNPFYFQAIDLVTRKSDDERLKWAFKLYDKDGSGTINVKEMAAVIETLEGLDGKITNKDMIGENGEFNKKSKTYVYAEKVFKLMDNDRDGEINVDEFVKGYQKLKSRQVLNTQYMTNSTLVSLVKMEYG